MSLAEHRRAVTWLRSQYEVSERRACQAMNMHRSSYRYGGRQALLDEAYQGTVSLSRQYPYWGYRKIYDLLRGDGVPISRERVRAIRRREGLQVHRKACSRKHVGHSGNSIARKRPQHVGHVWGLDFVHDETTDGRLLRWLTVIDEYSRFNLSVEVRRNFPSTSVVALLDELVAKYGYPDSIRCDNGPELISKTLKKWAKNKTAVLYIAPGSPWENGYTERFNGTFRAELLDQERFNHILEARVVALDWRAGYNQQRPHTSLNDRTPTEVFREGLKKGSIKRLS